MVYWSSWSAVLVNSYTAINMFIVLRAIYKKKNLLRPYLVVHTPLEPFKGLVAELKQLLKEKWLLN